MSDDWDYLYYANRQAPARGHAAAPPPAAAEKSGTECPTCGGKRWKRAPNGEIIGVCPVCDGTGRVPDAPAEAITDSCGCVFCDLGVPAIHHTPSGQFVPCDIERAALERAAQRIDKRKAELDSAGFHATTTTDRERFYERSREAAKLSNMVRALADPAQKEGGVDG